MVWRDISPKCGNVDELREALAFWHGKGCAIFLLGGGSNILFSDAGYDGMVIRMMHNALQIHNDVLITCGAGQC